MVLSTPETLLTFSLMFQLAVASSNIGKIMVNTVYSKSLMLKKHVSFLARYSKVLSAQAGQRVHRGVGSTTRGRSRMIWFLWASVLQDVCLRLLLACVPQEVRLLLMLARGLARWPIVFLGTPAVL